VLYSHQTPDVKNAPPPGGGPGPALALRLCLT